MAVAAADPPCCVASGEPLAQGPLNRGRDLVLDARSPRYRFDSGVAPVSVWRFDTPPVGAWLELLVDDQSPRAADAGQQPIEAPWPAVVLQDELGQSLPVHLIGPQLERRGRMRLRWWLALPASSARLLVGLDADAVGQLRPLIWTVPAPVERVAGVAMRGADQRKSILLRVTDAGEVKLRLHAN